jgi:predicted metal-binding membrane protein
MRAGTVTATRPAGVERPTAAVLLALAAVGALAAVAWVVAARRMAGMDMGVATDLGPLGPFLATWAPMMAAMMLPGAGPAIADRARAGARAALLFAASYLALWAAAGVAVHALYRPHGTLAAGAITVAAGLYELSPVKRRSRRHCRAGARSGLEYGAWCIGSSAGLMAVAVALGPMSVTWMALAAAAVLAQKLLAPAPAVDVPVALAIVALGVLVAAAPAAIPGLMPAM